MGGLKEDKSGWSAFLRHLVDRGLSGLQLVASNACRGLVESAADLLQDQHSSIEQERYLAGPQ